MSWHLICIPLLYTLLFSMCIMFIVCFFPGSEREYVTVYNLPVIYIYKYTMWSSQQIPRLSEWNTVELK